MMNKLLLIFLSIILFVLVTVTGTLFYAFSSSGNDLLKTYLHEELEEKIGLPVEVRKFTLEAGKSSLSMRINKEAAIKVEVHYDLLAQTFKGIYHVKAENFHYEKMTLRDIDIQGHFKGVAEDIEVDGIGSALDAPLAYHFRLLEQMPQNIEANIKGMALSEVLELTGQPPLATGQINVEINMPDIGKEFANGYGHIVLDKAVFNAEEIKKTYDLTVPKKSYVSGNIDLKLNGNNLNFLVNTQSNLFNLNIKDASVNLENKKVFANYMMDVKEMAILTQNKLAGPLKVTGNVEVKNEKYYVKGSTNTLGGALLFDISERSQFHFENLELAKILHLTKQPHYAKGLLSGSADLDKALESGQYKVKVQKGQFGAKSIAEKFGYQIPSINSFSFDSTGEIVKKVLNANVTLKSTLSDVKLTEVVYDIGKKKLNADYDVFLPNIGLLMPNNKAVKRGYMSVKGNVTLDKTLYVKGSAKGLGEKLDFTYDSKTATVNANDLFVEKLLSLSALPRYVKGKLSSSVNITNIKNLDGSFSFKSAKLVTQPNVMKRLIDKKLNIAIALESKGKLKSGIAYINTKMKTSMGNLTLDNMVFNTKNSTFKSTYVLDIPALEKTYALTEKKLYGPMLLSGDISQDKALKVTGMTKSLGGNIEYTLIGDALKSKITKVSLENILGMLGHKKLVKGDAYGTVTYHIKNKVGVIDIDINSFQIKPSSTTNTVKMFIGKDPARIIYNSTKLHADIKGDITRYSLVAKGSHSRIEVTNGKLDKVNNKHTAKFKFVYDKYEVTGTIGGTVENPRILVDPSSIMQSKTGEKIQKKLDKALGGEMGKAVGGFLKGLKF